MEVSTFIWMFLVLKLPIVAALMLIWWAVKEPEPDTSDEDTGGPGNDREPPHGPRRPRPPRRGPHATPPPRAPRRVRTVSGRRLERLPRR